MLRAATNSDVAATSTTAIEMETGGASPQIRREGGNEGKPEGPSSRSMLTGRGITSLDLGEEEHSYQEEGSHGEDGRPLAPEGGG